MRQVLNLLGWHSVARSGLQMRGPCLIHRSDNDQSRSFEVNTEKNVFQCFKPGRPAKGNQLDVYALATGLPILEAAHQLRDRLGLLAPLLSRKSANRKP